MTKFFTFFLGIIILLGVILSLDSVQNFYHESRTIPFIDDSIKKIVLITTFILLSLNLFKNNWTYRLNGDQIRKVFSEFKIKEHQINFHFNPDFNKTVSYLILLKHLSIATFLGFLPIIGNMVLSIFFGNRPKEIWIYYSQNFIHNLPFILVLTLIITSFLHIQYYSYYLTFHDKRITYGLEEEDRNDPNYYWANVNIDKITFTSSDVIIYDSHKCRLKRIKGVLLDKDIESVTKALKEFRIKVINERL